MSSPRTSGEWSAILRQQATVARLGQLGLAGASLQELVDESALAVAEVLEARDAVFLELLPSWQELSVRAVAHDGRLVPARLVLDVVVPAGRGSQAGYTLMMGGPVASRDLRDETRFHSVAAQFGQGSQSGLTAMIGWEDEPWGVLGVNVDDPREWTDDETNFLVSVGNVIGLSIQRKRSEDELRDTTTRLDLSLAAAKLGTWVWDVRSGRMHLSGALEHLTGNDAYGGTFEEFLTIVHEQDRDRLLDAAQESFAGSTDLNVVYRVRRADGEMAWIEARGRPLFDITGQPDRMVGVATDVTERQMVDEIRQSLLDREHQARLAAEAAQGRLAFLASASATLNQSLDAGDTLSSLASLLVPTIADICLIDMVDADGTLIEAAGRAVTHRLLQQVRELRQMRTDLGDGGAWIERSVREAHSSRLVTEISDEALVRTAASPEHLAALRRLAVRSSVVVPLSAAGEVIGVLTLLCTEPGRSFDDADLALVEDLAGRATMAVENARLFESRNRVARALQAQLLPPALPEIPRIQVAARYRVAEAGTEIGGDFYDLFEVGDGSWAVVIGDVCGRGPEAAAITGLMRHSIRAAAVQERMPSRVLGQANQAVLGQIDDTSFATAALLRLEPPPADGRPAWVTASSGGHPRPILVQPDGRVGRVECAGTLLGVLPRPPLTDATFDVGPGAAVVLYTDGITEARRDGEQFGETRLEAVIAGLAGASADDMAAGIEAAVVAFQTGGSDDLAVVVLRVVP
ncbi:MAG TPA: SpoIIE family protein phosphatase [Acidimicrobiales bacterium]